MIVESVQIWLKVKLTSKYYKSFNTHKMMNDENYSAHIEKNLDSDIEDIKYMCL